MTAPHHSLSKQFYFNKIHLKLLHRITELIIFSNPDVKIQTFKYILLMKTITFKLLITLLTFSSSIGVMTAQNLSVTHEIDGALATEINTAMTAASMTAVTEIENLTISGINITMSDAPIIKSCTNLVTIDVSGVTFSTIMAGLDAGGLFAGLTNLRTAVLPNNFTQIGKGAFLDCTRLESVLIKDEDGSTSNLFSKDNTKITLINALAFRSCSSLLITELPSSVANMGKHVFLGCTLLNITEIPGYTNNKLQESLFRECGITDFTLPASVTTIEKTVFYTTGGGLDRILIIKTTAPTFIASALQDKKNVFGDAATIARTTIKVLKGHEASFSSWTELGLKIETLKQNIIVNLTNNGTVSVAGGGLVSAAGNVTSGTEVAAYEGETISFNFTPANGFKIGTITLDGETITSGQVLTIDSKTQKTLSVTFVVDTATDVNLNETGNIISIYLNPSTDIVNIKGIIRVPVLLFDYQGRQLLETTENTINLSSINSGVYILKVNNQTFKVVKR